MATEHVSNQTQPQLNVKFHTIFRAEHFNYNTLGMADTDNMDSNIVGGLFYFVRHCLEGVFKSNGTKHKF